MVLVWTLNIYFIVDHFNTKKNQEFLRLSQFSRVYICGLYSSLQIIMFIHLWYALINSVSRSVRQPVSHDQSLSHSVTQSHRETVSQALRQSDPQALSQSVSQSDSQSVSQSVSQSGSQTASRSVSQSVSQSASQSVGRPVGRLVPPSVSQSIFKPLPPITNCPHFLLSWYLHFWRKIFQKDRPWTLFHQGANFVPNN